MVLPGGAVLSIRLGGSNAQDLLAATGAFALMASVASARAAVVTVLNFSEQGQGLTVVSVPPNDLATATSISATSYAFPQTFTLIAPFWER